MDEPSGTVTLYGIPCLFCTAHEASLCCSWSKGLLDCLAQGCLLQAALTNGQGGPFQDLPVLRFHLSPQPLHWPRATKQHHLDSEAKSASLWDNCPEYVHRYRLNPGQVWEGVVLSKPFPPL